MNVNSLSELKKYDLFESWKLEDRYFMPLWIAIASQVGIFPVIGFKNVPERQKWISSDKLKPIRECYELWISYLHHNYFPNWSNLKIGVNWLSNFVALREKCQICYYMPSKPVNYGLKFWVICDYIASYYWKLEI